MNSLRYPLFIHPNRNYSSARNKNPPAADKDLETVLPKTESVTISEHLLPRQ